MNNEKKELESIIDEKIYDTINKIFMYFQINGCSIQISNGCNPYSIIIVDDVKIGLKNLKPKRHKTNDKNIMKISRTIKITSVI